ncbi:MAG: sulfurtransferase TusA family protein [Candidatus Methylopumilus sp.]|nr:sulfurtransferase TusA family protein [Candidatus Methylopumilus sp.]
MHFDSEVDATGLKCPLPILKCKKSLNEIKSNQVLKIIATDPGSKKDFEAFCRQTGHTLLSMEDKNNIIIFYIKKRDLD